MRWRYLVLTLATAAALLAAWWFLQGGDDETRIRRQLDELASVASQPGPEPDVVALGKARRLGESFTETVEVADSEGGVLKGRRAVIQAIAGVREQQGQVVYELEDVEVSIESDTTASARLVVRAEGDDPAGVDGTRASIRMEKIDGDWLVATAFVER